MHVQASAIACSACPAVGSPGGLTDFRALPELPSILLSLALIIGLIAL